MKKLPLTELSQLILWQRKARRSRIRPPGQKDYVTVRLISRYGNSFFPMLVDRFGKEGLYKLPRAAAFDLRMVDPWIEQLIAESKCQSCHQARDAAVQAVESPAAPKVPLPIETPGFITWQVCNPAEVTRAIAALDERRDSGGRKKVLERLAKDPVRLLPLVTEGHIDAVEDLSRAFPNFRELTTEIIQDLMLKLRLGDTLTLPHVLLHGPPGTGKSLFAQRLADALGFHFRSFSFAQMTAGFLLTGSSDRWNASTMGVFADAVINAPPGKVPLIFGDELDKAATGRQYPTDTTLLNVMEPNTAQTFMDEYLGVALDLRPVSMMLAANVITHVRPEIMSRATPIHVRLPTDDEMPALIRSVDRFLRDQSRNFDKAFEPLSDDVLGCLMSTAPRALYRTLRRGYAVASSQAPRDGSLVRMQPEHLGKLAARKSGKIGNNEGDRAQTPDQMVEHVVRQAMQTLYMTFWNPEPRRYH